MARKGSFAALLVGAGVTAGAMFFLDPVSGRRRRALVRDRVSSTVRNLASGLRGRALDLGNRARGAFARAQALLESGRPTPDKLENRVRSRIDRLMEQPHSVDVRADAEGTVTLSGRVRQNEVHPVLREVATTKGVHSVNNYLAVGETPRVAFGPTPMS